MHIHGRTTVEGGRERFTLVPESLDDLWHLSYVLEPGDLVSGDTTRRIQRDDDRMRDTGGEREPMSVTLSVEEMRVPQVREPPPGLGVITDWLARGPSRATTTR